LSTYASQNTTARRNKTKKKCARIERISHRASQIRCRLFFFLDG
jgi:hypothetical protein